MTNPLPARRAATTRWSQVLAAMRDGTPEGDAALAGICETYWYPVYAFIRRQEGDGDAAAELAQAFFGQVLEKRFLRDVRPERGRFRSFLFAAVRHFLSNERDRTHALKRGGGTPTLPIDVETAEGQYRREPAHHLTPERLFDRQWAIAVLEQVFARLQAEMEAAGRGSQYGRLKPLLCGDMEEGYGAVAEALGMTEGATRVAVHRLRRRYRDLLRGAIADLVESPEEIEEELRHLIAAVGP